MAADQAFVTCVTNDTYALGALVLGHSLRSVQTSKQLAVIITSEVSDKIREQLKTVYDHIETVNVLDSKDETNLALLTRPDLGVTFTKFHCWRLTRYNKCVFLDADTLVIQNCDELFEKDELSAVPDVGWPDCFNSGVFVYHPSDETYKKILDFAVTHGSFDGGDQGVLNMFFSDWRTSDISRHLSFIYNMNANVTYTYLPAYKQFGKTVKIVHFLGAVKPWMQAYNPQTGRIESDSPHSAEHLQMWWDVFMKTVQPDLSQESKGLAGDLARMHITWPASEARQPSSEARQYAWERGQIDYMGADAFENIERKLQSAITESKPEGLSSKIDLPPLMIPAKVETSIKSSPNVDTVPAQVPQVGSPKTEAKVQPSLQSSPSAEVKVESPKVQAQVKPSLQSSPSTEAKAESPKVEAKVKPPLQSSASTEMKVESPKAEPKVRPLLQSSVSTETAAKAAPKVESPTKTAPKMESVTKKVAPEPAKKTAPAAEASAQKKTPTPKKETPTSKKEAPKKSPQKKSPK